MNPKVLSILLVVGTLVLGIILGVVGSGALHNKRMKDIQDIRRPRGFTEYITRIAEPVDDAQKQQIEEVLSAFGQHFRDLGGRQQVEMKGLADSMIVELGTVLSDEQLGAVQDALSKRRRQDKDDSRDRRSRRPRTPRDSTGVDSTRIDAAANDSTDRIRK